MDARLTPGVTLSSADNNCGMTLSGGALRAEHRLEDPQPLLQLETWRLGEVRGTCPRSDQQVHGQGSSPGSSKKVLLESWHFWVLLILVNSAQSCLASETVQNGVCPWQLHPVAVVPDPKQTPPSVSRGQPQFHACPAGNTEKASWIRLFSGTQVIHFQLGSPVKVLSRGLRLNASLFCRL